LAEFTGERVIPGQVDPDLWNEHLARYRFAARYARGAKRVLDAGCGSGYGSAALGAHAQQVVGIDFAREAVEYARTTYALPNLHFVQASGAALPFPDRTFDFAASFEVIEHLPDWKDFLRELRRVVAPGGRLLISTPNEDYYAESRRETGPNPYHVHEFKYEEFAAELRELFPSVTLFLQNHVQGVGFEPGGSRSNIEAFAEPAAQDAHEANFFVALCGDEPPSDTSLFIYVPSTANLLREREQHIARLESELDLKNAWLNDAKDELQRTVAMFRTQTAELEERNRWAAELDGKLREAGERIVAVQDELVSTRQGYEDKIHDLESDLRTKIDWALRTDEELRKCAELLDTAEKTVIERSDWAMRLQSELDFIKSSRWYRLGMKLGVGPEGGKG
jgi:SAM-dependent methyltransferase